MASNTTDDSSQSADKNVGNKALTKKKFSFIPITCPVTDCKATLVPNAVMSHYLNSCQSDFPLGFQEMRYGKRATLVFDEEAIKFAKVVCLGALAFGGPEGGKESELPAAIGVCDYNAFLPESEKQLKGHLPLIIMATKISWTSALKLKSSGEIPKEPTNPHDMVFAIWLVCPESTCTIYVTLTIYNLQMSWSRSTIIECRHFTDSPAPTDYLLADCFMRLTRSDMNALTNNGTSTIRLEVTVNDCVPITESS